jgi:oligosaccharyltransferase complex subunit alpha (ribophorin I)
MGNSFRSITAMIPPHAFDLYYRDQIGNVSTSHVREGEEYITWEVEPRFPMFGGWQTDFYIGYNLPASSYLSTSYDDSSLHVLNISFASPFPQMAIDELEVHVVLPEFVSDVQFVTPFEIDSREFATKLTYLDSTGRTVLILRKSNAVRQHYQNFQVVYRFSRVMMLQEPILLIAAAMLFFVVSIIYVRIDLSLGNSKKSN